MARGAGRGAFSALKALSSRARREQDSLYKDHYRDFASAPVQGLGSIPGQGNWITATKNLHNQVSFFKKGSLHLSIPVWFPLEPAVLIFYVSFLLKSCVQILQ